MNLRGGSFIPKQETTHHTTRPSGSTLMQDATWIIDARDWLARDRDFAFSKPHKNLLETPSLDGPAYGSVSVELTSLTSYLAKEGVFQLVAGDARGWETLSTAGACFQNQVRLIAIAEQRQLYNNRLIPTAVGEIVLGIILDLYLGAHGEGWSSLGHLKALSDAGRFCPKIVAFVNFGFVVASIATARPVDRALLSECAIFREGLESFIDGDRNGGLMKLAEVHRAQSHEMNSTLGLFAWEPFNIFPVEILVLMRAGELQRGFKDSLIWDAFQSFPARVQPRQDLLPLLKHLSKLCDLGQA